MTYAGTTSVDVTIEISSQVVTTGETRHTNTARVTMVALKDGVKTTVPKLIPESREEKLRYLEGKLRREARARLANERKELEEKLNAATDEKIEAWMELDSIERLLETE